MKYDRPIRVLIHIVYCVAFQFQISNETTKQLIMTDNIIAGRRNRNQHDLEMCHLKKTERRDNIPCDYKTIEKSSVRRRNVSQPCSSEKEYYNWERKKSMIHSLSLSLSFHTIQFSGSYRYPVLQAILIFLFRDSQQQQCE